MIKLEGGFISNLGKVYGLYTLGFLGFVILMAILEASGVSNTIIGWLFVVFPGLWGSQVPSFRRTRSVVWNLSLIHI